MIFRNLKRALHPEKSRMVNMGNPGEHFELSAIVGEKIGRLSRFDQLKNANASALRHIDGWVKGRLRSILRKRVGLKEKEEEQTNRSGATTSLPSTGTSSLEAARSEEITGLQNPAKH